MLFDNTCVVLLPTLNEVNSIGQMIDEIQEYIPPARIIVADSGSLNGTKEVVEKKGINIIHSTPGKGRTVQAAWYYFRYHCPSVESIMMLDSDGTYPTDMLPIMFYVLSRMDYDVVSGSRISDLSKREKGAMPFMNLLGNKVLTEIANILYPIQTTDLCTGYWGFNRKALESIDLSAKNFELEADVFVEMNRNKLRYFEYPITYKARVGSKPKLRLSDGYKIASWLIKKRFE